MVARSDFRQTPAVAARSRAPAGGARLWPRGFGRNVSGSIALKFAFAVPVLGVLTAGSVDLAAVTAAQSHMQTIADASALDGAPALSLAADGATAEERARASVAAQMAEWPEAPEYEAEFEAVEVNRQRALRVTLRASRPSFFGNLLPPGGWKFKASATASTVSMVPLCVLATGSNGPGGLALPKPPPPAPPPGGPPPPPGPDGNKLINVHGSGTLSAPACMVHSNKDIQVDGGSLSAAMIQAVASASGVMTPAATTGAVRIDDPFINLDLDQTRRLYCTETEKAVKKIKVETGTYSLAPGPHCGGIEAKGDARIVLEPGDHFMLGGHLDISGDARLEGTDVAVFFDRASKFDFRDNAMVSLDGRKSGPYAGLVLGGTRDNTEDFMISADHVESLLGVIYIPSARLVVRGTADVARESAWTVIVAKGLRLDGSPSLFINANYGASDVPVPSGVGPRAGGARLIN